MTAAEQAVVNRLSDWDVVALTLFGEARNQGPEGRIAVACVIRNRVAAKRPGFGLTPRQVCLQPSQFSCWMAAGGAANHELLMGAAQVLVGGGRMGPVLRECQWIAAALFTEDLTFVDCTHGATHYVTSTLYATTPPSWAVNARLCAHIGDHVFLRAA